MAGRSSRSFFRSFAFPLFLFSVLTDLSHAAEAPYVPTPQIVVDKMLEMGKVQSSDFVMDLGSGDGRIVITAAKKHGARGMGVEIDPKLVEIAKDNAWREGVRSRVEFHQRDLYRTDLRQATVVTLYLLPEVNLRLRPKLLAELRPGSRVVSHDYDLGEWGPDDSALLQVPGKTAGGAGSSSIMLWVIPANVIGTWELKLVNGDSVTTSRMELDQTYQYFSGSLKSSGKPDAVEEGHLDGTHIAFSVKSRDGTQYSFTGEVEGRYMDGEVERTSGGQAATLYWKAQRLTPPKPLEAPPGR